MNRRASAGRNSADSAKKRPDTPLRNFAAIRSATARPVPGGRSRKQIRSPPGALTHPPQRPSRAVFASWQRLQAGAQLPDPRTALVASMRHDVVDHRRRYHAASALACGTQRVLRQEGSAGPAPARTVASACRARPLPVQLALHLRRALHPGRTMHGRLHGQRPLHNTKPAAAMPGGLSRHTLRAWSKTTSCDGQRQAATTCGSVLDLDEAVRQLVTIVVGAREVLREAGADHLDNR